MTRKGKHTLYRGPQFLVMPLYTIIVNKSNQQSVTINNSAAVIVININIITNTETLSLQISSQQNTI